MASNSPSRGAVQSTVGRWVANVAGFLTGAGSANNGRVRDAYQYFMGLHHNPELLKLPSLLSDAQSIITTLDAPQRAELATLLFEQNYVVAACIEDAEKLGNYLPFSAFARLLWTNVGLKYGGLENVITTLTMRFPVLRLTRPSDYDALVNLRSASGVSRMRGKWIAGVETWNEWLSSLRDQGWIPSMYAYEEETNQQIRRALFPKLESDSRPTYPQFWMLREYGNFPLGIKRIENKDFVIKIWNLLAPSKYEAVALYAMCPSMNSYAEVVRDALQSMREVSEIAHVFRIMAYYNADAENVRRLYDLGVLTEDDISRAYDQIVNYATEMYFNKAILDAVGFKPYPNVQTALSHSQQLLKSRWDAWNYALSDLSADEQHSIHNRLMSLETMRKQFKHTIQQIKPRPRYR